MNHGWAAAHAFVCDWAATGQRAGSAAVAIAPVSLCLRPLFELNQQLGAALAMVAQDCSSECDGAFTGECSATMLAECGARAVIIGHSERRQRHGENGFSVSQKMQRALDAALLPILCVGELLADREAGRAELVVETQLTEALKPIETSSQFVVAYEPVWAIGTGRNASVSEAAAMHTFIREVLFKLGFDGKNTSVIYGGSVNTANAPELFAHPEIDGALVGGASLSPKSFAALAAAAEVAWP